MHRKSSLRISLRLLSIVALAGIHGLPSALAQSSSEQMIESIIVTGTRTSGRSAIDSPAPIDIISAADISNQAGGDMADIISKMVPSYNVRATGDAASLVRPASLRGLPTDATLVLVNGKRRHRAAVISFIGAGVFDGSQGADVSTIPASAISRLEVLRDGAAAQYGSDAIAGVMNFILKDDASGGVFEVKLGETYQGDGEAYQMAGNVGLPLTSDGFINTSVEYRKVEGSDRSVQRSDAAALIAGGNMAVNDPAQRWGLQRVFDDFKSFINMGLDLSEDSQWYAFGSYSKRRVETDFSYRNPNTRSGVYASALNLAGAEADANGNEIPFLVDQDNNTITRDQIVDADGLIRSDLDNQDWVRRYDRLVADLTPDGISGNCPQTNASNEGGLDIRDAAGLVAVDADAQCFVFNEWLPGGFAPRFGSNLSDVSLVTGLRGIWANSLKWDLSAGTGRNEAEFFIRDTVNGSLGPSSSNNFMPGSNIQSEQNINADATYVIEGNFEQNIAAGVEWRKEQFEVVAGEAASWQAGPLVDQGFSIGSNGFTGFGPDVVGEWSRTNIAVYGDYEVQATPDVLLGAALRWEDYDTFGSTTNYKISGYWSISDTLALRATQSSGFRAPTPGQANISNITTLLSNGVLINRGTLPPTDPIARLYGGEELTPERSENYSVGAVMNFGDVVVTIDGYQIEMRDRLTQSADIQLTAQQAQDLEDAGFSGASQLRSFRFYVNDFDTKTRGVDLVATYAFDMMAGQNLVTFIYNYNKTDVTYFNPATLDSLRIRQIEESLPSQRANLSWSYVQGPWRSLLRINYFGDYWIAHAGDPSLAFEPGAEVTLDAEAAFSLGEDNEYTVVVGAENLFNNFPDRNPYGTVIGAKYPESAPMGIAGGVYYLRFQYKI
jgi:iron complex outermembrane receptor protein